MTHTSFNPLTLYLKGMSRNDWTNLIMGLIVALILGYLLLGMFLFIAGTIYYY